MSVPSSFFLTPVSYVVYSYQLAIVNPISTAYGALWLHYIMQQGMLLDPPSPYFSLVFLGGGGGEREGLAARLGYPTFQVTPPFNNYLIDD